MRKVLSIFVAIAFAALPLRTDAVDTKEQDRLENCDTVLEEILNVPDNIPTKLLDKAECVIVIPSVIKGAMGIGGSYGRGVMTCRSGEHFTGKWSAPSMVALEGASFGFQLGGEATDFVLLIMNPRGVNAILSSKVKLGGDISAAAGPKGRDAEADTDVTLRSEMLTYSRSRGLFAGVSLEGSTLRPDNAGNQDVYGKKIDAMAIVRKNTAPVPKAAQKLIALLDKHSRKNESDPNSLK